MTTKHHKTGVEWLIGSPLSLWNQFFVTMLILGIGLVAWEYLGSYDRFLASSPGFVAEYVYERGWRIGDDLRASIGHFIIGYVPGALAGIIIGTILGLYPKASSAVAPYLRALQSVPRTSQLFIVILLLGFSMKTLVMFNIIVTIPFVTVIYLQGIQMVWDDYPGIERDFRNRLEVLKYVIWPASRQSRYLALQQSASILWPTLIASEYFIFPDGKGIGVRLWRSFGDFNLEGVYAMTFLLSLCGLVTLTLLNLLEHRKRKLRII